MARSMESDEVIMDKDEFRFLIVKGISAMHCITIKAEYPIWSITEYQAGKWLVGDGCAPSLFYT
jgi:hypothetical protein